MMALEADRWLATMGKWDQGKRQREFNCRCQVHLQWLPRRSAGIYVAESAAFIVARFMFPG
jgi:hypothetical protein